MSENNLEELLPVFNAAINSQNYEQVQALCLQYPLQDISERLNEEPVEVICQVLEHLDLDTRSEVFEYLKEDIQIQITQVATPQILAPIIEQMASDERVDLIKQLPEELQHDILDRLGIRKQQEYNQLAQYPEGSAGSVMSPEFIAFEPELLVSQAIHRIRMQAVNKETIYYGYVLDSQKKLVGVLSLKDLILSDPDAPLENIMQKATVFAYVDDDQELAAQQVSKYDLLAVPVIDKEQVMLGFITYDDAMDILKEEEQEDIEKFMAISGKHTTGTYLKTSSWQHMLNRAPWIISLAIIGLISGGILHYFETTLETLFILALYVPMIADAGGNTGSQSATVVIRSLALGELSFRQLGKVLIKELKISLMLGSMLGILTILKVVFLSFNVVLPAGFYLLEIAGVIALALLIQVVTSTLIGAILPMVAFRFKFDPAVVASPAITTLVDITGLLIFFTLAKSILSI